MLNPIRFELRASSHELERCGLAARSSWLVALCMASVLNAFAQDSLNVTRIYQWSDPTLPASFLYDNTYNSVWGYARDEREYAIIGSTMGTHIIDVTPNDITGEIAFIPGNDQGGDIVHREYKTYRDRLYAVTDEGAGTLQIIDLRYLPDSAPVIYDDDALFHRAHSIWIDTANARLYTHYGSSDFAIWSLADPDAPTLLLKPQNSVSWWDDEVGGVHDAYTVNNITYTNDVDAMHIIDFSDVGAPVLLGSLGHTDYPQAGYNHSGWLHENGWLYVMADETHGLDLKLFDVSDPTSIEFIDTIGTDLGPGSIPHNPCFQGDLLHVAYYEDGYWLWSVADPYNAQLLGWYDMHPEPYSFSYKGAWGVYPFLPSGHVLISEMQHGLFVLDIAQALAVGPDAGGNDHALHIRPNPASGEVTITLPRDVGNNPAIAIADATGRSVVADIARRTSVEFTFDARNFAPGPYAVSITYGNRRWTTTLLKAAE
jgi:choice-of-anchor B domain-containing protein